ncbi:MAG: hypothetical protein ACK4ST_10800 [Elioraea tepidiphila]
MFNPLTSAPPPAPALRDEEWRAVAAALRPVAAQLRALAARELERPSWMPGQSVEDAAFAEGRKLMWRQMLMAMEDER